MFYFHIEGLKDKDVVCYVRLSRKKTLNNNSKVKFNDGVTNEVNKLNTGNKICVAPVSGIKPAHLNDPDLQV